ncbi:hypothetical protein AB0M96_37625, partial [Streptomyces sp. NPDC051098]
VVREDADAALMIAVAVCVIRMGEKERDEDCAAVPRPGGWGGARPAGSPGRRGRGGTPMGDRRG